MDPSRDEPIIPADGRLITIDILRGLAILWVVIYHLWGASANGFVQLPLPRTYYQNLGERLRDGDAMATLTAFTDLVFRLGYNGVTIFMILSGMSLTISAMRSRRPISLLNWYPTRLRKILIPYWAAWCLYLATLAAVALYRTQADGGTFSHNFQYLGLAHMMDFDRARAGLLIVPRLLYARHLNAPSPTLWFILVLLQYYLLFPLLLPLLRRIGPAAFAMMALAVSVAATGWLIGEYGSIAGRGTWWRAWFPFRFFEFGIGIVIGYLMAEHPRALRRALSPRLALLALIGLGLGLHTWGSWIDVRNGYWDAISYQLVAAGFATLILALVVARPGAILTSAPARLIAFVGTISYTVLIVNESFLYLNYYFIVQGYQWTVGWWYYVVVLYVPLTVILAYPLAVVLGLVPKPVAKRKPAPSGDSVLAVSP
jgi:peptidoglycan/LPS O-acetylase OafA/YrhL